MSVSEQPEPGPAAEEPEPAGESGGMSERTAKVVLLAVAMLAAWGIVAVAPYAAYFVAGIIACVGWQKGRGWIGRRQGSDKDDIDELEDEEAPEKPAETVVETLQRLANPHVFLADFADARSLSKESARAVLEALNIRVRRAVRNGDDTGVGVHRDDLPPLPSPSREAPETPVDQGQPTNQQGLRVEPIGLAGTVVRDPADAVRHHRIRK